MIYRIRRNLDNIQESTTILAIYDDDIMNLQILTRDIPRFRSFCVWWRDIQELVIFNNDRHLNILLILRRYRAFPPHSFSVARYRSYFSNRRCDDIRHFLWLFCFWWHRRINPFMTISSYSGFLCVWRYFAFLDLSAFSPIYLDFVHFRPPFLIIRLMSFPPPPPISPTIWANSA
jgi:hypothetical protein